MRISDWSSDVCSSDLHLVDPECRTDGNHQRADDQHNLSRIHDELSPSCTHQRRSCFSLRSSDNLKLVKIVLVKRPQARSGDRDPIGHLSHFVRRAQFHMRSEEHTSELQSLMRISYAVFCLKK